MRPYFLLKTQPKSTRVFKKERRRFFQIFIHLLINSALTIYDVWEQSGKGGLKLDAMLMRLEVVALDLMDLVKR
jgi:hypothetical protein